MNNITIQIQEAVSRLEKELSTNDCIKDLLFLTNTIIALANSLQSSPIDALCTNSDYQTFTFTRPIILRVPNTFKINAPLIPNLFAVKNCFLNGLPIPNVTDFSINFNNLDDDTNQVGIVIRGTCDELFNNNEGVYIFELFTSAKTSKSLYRFVDDKPWIEFDLTSFRVAIPKNLDQKSLIKYLIENLVK